MNKILLSLLFILLSAACEQPQAPSPTPMNETKESLGHFTGQGFSFDYPLFQYWNIIAEAERIVYNPGIGLGIKLEVAPSVTIKKVAIKVEPDFWDKQQANSKGVQYFVGEQDERTGMTKVTFRLASESVEISLPKNTTIKTFSGEQAYQTIVNTFTAE